MSGGDATLVWERQPGEPPRAFDAFTVYRGLPPRQRSLDEVSRRQDGPQTSRKRAATGQIQRWSRDWRWVERAATWDGHLDAMGRAAAEEAIRKLNRDQMALLNGAFGKVVKALAEMDHKKLSPGEVRLWMTSVVQLQRLVAGAPVAFQEHQLLAPGAEPPTRRAAPGSFPLFEPTPEYLAAVMAIVNTHEVPTPEEAPGPPPEADE